MNHGSLGFITESGIQLPLDVINLLSIGKEGCLFGLFYPSPKGMKGYEAVTQDLDFMLTPVEPRLWSRSARMLIHLAQKPGSLKKVIEYLASKNISVIHAEGSRSAHRYATWSLHVAFEDPAIPFEYDSIEQVYKPMLDKLKELVSELEFFCKDSLFQQRSNSNSLPPVEVWPNTALSYFHNFVEEKRQKLLGRTNIYEPFELNLSNNGFLDAGKMKVKSILIEYLNSLTKNILPSIVFAEFDSKSLNIRLAIIPQNNLKKFLEICIAYQRIGESEPCVGVISEVLNRFPPEYNIWHSYNFTKSQSKSHKQGKLLFLIEDCGHEKHAKDYLEKAKEKLKGIEKVKIRNRITFSEPTIIPLSHKRVTKLMKDSLKQDEKYKYDVFLSYSEQDLVLAKKLGKILKKNNIRYYMAKEKISGGDKFGERILDDLIHSREVCVLCTRESMDSKWVHTECGAALALRKKIIPILYKFPSKDLPHYLHEFHSIPLEAFKESYVKELEERIEDSDINRFLEEFTD